MAYLGRVKPTETTSSVLRSTYTGDGSTTTYNLPGPVSDETAIIATINGVTQQDAAYTTNGSQIIFSGAPALGDSIELRTISAVAMSYAPADGSVVTGKIADLAVTTGKIADNSITTAKIAAGAVVQADIGTNVAGTGPLFAASFTGNPAITANTNTKIGYSTEEFDTNNNYDTSLQRFTPTVAGWYFIQASTVLYGANQAQYDKRIMIWKNGVEYKKLHIDGYYGYANNNTGITVSSIVYFNGSTDYVEAYALMETNGNFIGGGSTQSYFYGYMVRAA